MARTACGIVSSGFFQTNGPRRKRLSIVGTERWALGIGANNRERNKKAESEMLDEVSVMTNWRKRERYAFLLTKQHRKGRLQHQ